VFILVNFLSARGCDAAHHSNLLFPFTDVFGWMCLCVCVRKIMGPNDDDAADDDVVLNHYCLRFVLHF
jgi:hypothetical protein